MSLGWTDARHSVAGCIMHHVPCRLHLVPSVNCRNELNGSIGGNACSCNTRTGACSIKLHGARSDTLVRIWRMFEGILVGMGGFDNVAMGCRSSRRMCRLGAGRASDDRFGVAG
ncbi:hypothetical protein LIA77_06849 [Sarocladium implicatum]|nr:hypothetical protein LIA77_06849 [Sarocladium implicatum]